MQETRIVQKAIQSGPAGTRKNSPRSDEAYWTLVNDAALDSMQCVWWHQAHHVIGVIVLGALVDGSMVRESRGIECAASMNERKKGRKNRSSSSCQQLDGKHTRSSVIRQGPAAYTSWMEIAKLN